jgi:hypothetical protein
VLLSVFTRAVELPDDAALPLSAVVWAPANGEKPKAIAIAAVVIITFFMFVMTSS